MNDADADWSLARCNSCRCYHKQTQWERKPNQTPYKPEKYKLRPIRGKNYGIHRWHAGHGEPSCKRKFHKENTQMVKFNNVQN